MSILQTVFTPSICPTTGQLKSISHHLFSSHLSISACFENHALLLEKPPEEPYSLEQDDISERAQKRRARKRRKLDDEAGRPDVEDLQEDVAVMATMRHVLELLRDQQGEGKSCLGDLDKNVDWISKTEYSGLREIDWAQNTYSISMSVPTNSSPKNVESNIVDLVAENALFPLASLPKRIIRNSSNKIVNLEIETISDRHEAVEENDSQSSTPTAQLVLPPGSAFLLSDFSSWSEPESPIKTFAKTVNGFDLIILDPPWPNRSAQRSSSYETFDPYSLFKLDIPSIVKLGNKPCLIATWVTNRPKYINFLKNKLFPSWSISPSSSATWYWLKTTPKGLPVTPINDSHRKPYERLILGWSFPEGFEGNKRMELEDGKVFVGCTAGHSRKPVLWDLLEPYLENSRDPSNVLEFFARTAFAGPNMRDGHERGNWLSVGNESCKFNIRHRPEAGIKGYLRQLEA